jgi:3-methyladenine DNA glycosylase/8-oxoguanine DNA glycosylase
MSLSKTTLSAIQQAGQALHKATVVVAGAVREQAEHMVATVASQPFQAEGEQAFANFKMLARLSQDLQSLEEQLRNLYATASELASPVMDVVAALPHSAARSRPVPAPTQEVAEDAIVKPASVRRAKGAAKRGTATAVKATAKSPKPVKTVEAAKAVALTANDSKLLAFLQSVLSTKQSTALTGVQLAKGSGLPLGSVGVSLKKVIASGAVKKIGRSSYQRMH